MLIVIIDLSQLIVLVVTYVLGEIFNLLRENGAALPYPLKRGSTPLLLFCYTFYLLSPLVGIYPPAFIFYQFKAELVKSFLKNEGGIF